MRQSILIVDDKPDMLKLLERIIKTELDVEVRAADNGRAALDAIAAAPVSVVLADIRMPGMDGIELLREIKKLNEAVIVIMMTAFGTVETAVESLKLGAYDFVSKPFDEERLLHTLRLALERCALITKNQTLEQRIRDREAMERFVGQSPPVLKLIDTIRLVANTDVTVLITGETGTGKDLAAKTIHALSRRSDKPFVAVNCPAIPENILESELFGYKKGAFTGAMQDREGLFQTAHGGTMLLDEIGDISPPLQAKLLRVLQEKEMKPLGDNRTQKVDVRIIASTNQNLKEKIAADQFREDLYYRLNVVSIHTPSLKEIATDIPLLANHFLAHFSADFCVPQKRFSDEALRVLVTRKWSGNVRELQNAVKRAVIFSKSPAIEPADFSCETDSIDVLVAEETGLGLCSCEYKDARRSVLEKFNMQYITTLLQDNEGNVTIAAKKAGLERQSLQHLMKKYGIHADDFRKGANKI